MITITAKKNPDLDGYACSYALAELLGGKGCSCGKPQREVEFLNKEFNIKKLGCEIKGDVIIVDASNLKGMPDIDANRVIKVIDHRDVENVKDIFPNAEIQIEKVGACATLITEKFDKISRESAILLYGAIASNTLGFKGAVTTKRDRDAFSWLEKQTDIPSDLIERMFHFKSQFNNNTLEEAIRNDLKETQEGAIAQIEVIDVEAILEKRKDMILNLLDKIKEEQGFKYIFLSAIDLEKGRNYLITRDKESKKLLKKVFNISFERDVYKADFLKMRKEIMHLF